MSENALSRKTSKVLEIECNERKDHFRQRILKKGIPNVSESCCTVPTTPVGSQIFPALSRILQDQGLHLKDQAL